jgi:hypothetical protein
MYNINDRVDDLDRKLDRYFLALEQSRIEYDRRTAESKVEADRRAAESKVEADRIAAEAAIERAEARERSKALDVQIEKMSQDVLRVSKDIQRMSKSHESHLDNHGRITERYFFEALRDEKLIFFGEHFETVELNVTYIKKGINHEFDIVLKNGSKIFIIESKFNAHINDIPQILAKAQLYKRLYPLYANHDIYLGLASTTFYPDLEAECIKQGIAIIKRAGNDVTVIQEYAKIF